MRKTCLSARPAQRDTTDLPASTDVFTNSGVEGLAPTSLPPLTKVKSLSDTFMVSSFGG